MRILIFILFLLIFYAPQSNSQKQYFKTDSSATVGVNLIDGTDIVNAKYCRVQDGQDVKEYTPYEVTEYGFKNGRVFVSKEILINNVPIRVFLERLETEQFQLYYYRAKNTKTIFIEKDSTLWMELHNKEANHHFKQQLKEITSACPYVQQIVHSVAYSKKSVSRYLRRYEKCRTTPFPKIRYGMILGYELAKLEPIGNSAYDGTLIKASSENDALLPSEINEHLKNLDYTYNGGFTLGLFVDMPIAMSNFSLHAETFLSKHAYSFNKRTELMDVDFIANISAIKCPLLVRYSLPLQQIKPYVNAGFYGAYHFKSSNSFNYTSINNNIIETAYPQQISMDNIQLGYTMGAGTEYKLNAKNDLFMEVRYSRLKGSSKAESFRTSEINIVTGISF